MFAFRRLPRPGPPPLTATIELQGRVATSGTRALQLLFDAPGLWRDWRALGMVGAERLARAPYYGLGNTALDDSAEAANGDVLFYRYRLIRTTALGMVQRRIRGPLRAVGGLQWRHYRAHALEGGTTRLAEDIAAGTVADDTGSTDNFELRGGLVYDTRNEEGSPSRGVFLEYIAAHGLHQLGGDFDYSRWMASARGFLPVGVFTTLAMRAQIERAHGRLPFFTTYERLTTWRPEDGFGGGTTLRANLPGRWLAPNRALVSLDLRFRKFDIPLPRSPMRIWLLAYTDAGLVWLNGESPSTHNLQGGAGVGARLQYAKSGMLGLDLGYSRDSRFEFATAFQFAY